MIGLCSAYAAFLEEMMSAKYSWNEYWSSQKTKQRVICANFAYPEVIRLLLNLTTERSRCIEVGCGSGTYAIALLANNRKCIASDYSEEALNLTKMKAKVLYDIDVPTKLIDIYDIPYPDDSFDLVFSDGVVEHLDIPKALKEMERVIKPDGWIIAKVPSGTFLYRIIYYLLSPVENRPHEVWYSKKRWAKLMEESGFRNIEVNTCGSVINGLAMRIKSLAKLNKYSIPFGHIYYLIKARKL